jgi:sugar phosphate permease
MSSTKRNPFLLLMVIIAGEAIFFLPFVLPRIFRPTMLSVYELTNLELGTAFSAYGLVAIASYFFGGPLADRFSPKVLIATALISTGLGGFAFWFDIGYREFIMLYAYWGFTTIFLMWAAMIKATRLWGGSGFQGRAFGFLESGRGLTAAIIGTLALFAVSRLENNTEVTVNLPIREVILLASTFIVTLGLVIAKWMPNSKESGTNTAIKWQTVLMLIKKPEIWLQGLIIVFAYVGYKMTDDFSLFANEVLGFDQFQSASIGTVALWLRPVFALFAGLAADRWRVLNVISGCFVLLALGGFVIFLGAFDEWVFWSLSTMIFTVLGIYGLRGIYFAVMEEIDIPLSATGTAVGLMSVLGYTPDVFISPIMGYVLDTYPGAQGHHFVFAIISSAGIIGLLSVLILQKLVKSKAKHTRLA